MFSRYILTSLFLLLPVSSIWAGFTYQSVKYDMGVRPMSLAGAYVGLGEESGSLFYNPAGLATPGALYSYETLDMHKTNYTSFSNHVVYASPFGFSRWVKENESGDKVDATVLGFGHFGRNGVDWGVTYKRLVSEGSTDFSGWSSDLGLLVRFSPQSSFGINFKDVAKSDDISLPSTVEAGFSLFTPSRHFVFTTDLVQDREQDHFLFTRHGAEVNISDGLVLRGGVSRQDLTGGVSFIFPFFDLDFGFIKDVQEETATQYLWGVNLGRGTLTYRQRRKYSLFKHRSYAYFRVDSNLVEGKPDISFLGGKKIGSNDLLSLIHTANEDPSCKGYKIRVGSVSSSISSVGLIQEIRQELLKAKANGKEIVVYLEGWATLPEYYLASVADKIVMPELGTISHLGLDLEIVKTKEFLENFGIENRVISSGRHKDSLNPFSESIDESDRLVLEELVSDLYHQVLFEIKESRDLNWDQINLYFDGRMITAMEAKEQGLIDETAYWGDIDEKLSKDAFAEMEDDGKEDNEKKERTVIISLSDYQEPPEPVTLLSPFNRIAVVEIDGFIQQGQHQSNPLYGGKGTGSDEVSTIIDKISNDFTIKGVILRVNSPGGSIVASDQIYAAVKKMREKTDKPVFTSMGNVATSGGYYVSLGSERIFANPGTLTGSIGVISVFQNYEGLNEMLGIERDVIKTGRYADMFSQNRSLSDDEVDLLEAYQDQQYQVFVDRVVDNRKIDEENVREIAQGQVFTGEQAKALNLVDDLGNFYDVVDEMAKETKINNPVLVFFRKKSSFFPFFR